MLPLVDGVSRCNSPAYETNNREDKNCLTLLIEQGVSAIGKMQSENYMALTFEQLPNCQEQLSFWDLLNYENLTMETK